MADNRLRFLAAPDDTDAALRLAVEALTLLVKAEYPAGLSLVEIARDWGVGISPGHLSALERIESSRSAKPGLGLVNRPTEVGDIQSS